MEPSSRQTVQVEVGSNPRHPVLSGDCRSRIGRIGDGAPCRFQPSIEVASCRTPSSEAIGRWEPAQKGASMRFRAAASGVASVVVIGLAALSIGSVQQPPRQSNDSLVQQVQQLRVELDHYFRLSAAIAFTTNRANAVQMRITSLSSELADVRTQLARSSAELTPYVDLVKAQEAKHPSPSGSLDEYYVTPEYVAAKRQIEAHRELDHELRLRESQLAGTLANEQGKWNELSQRLDALEASIGTRSQ